MKYPYFLAPGQPRNACVPLIKVIYKSLSKRTAPILALVDSGAAVSFAPLDIALWLGIQVDKKKYLDIRGFNDIQTRCYPGITNMEINGQDITIPVYFGGGPKLQCIIGQDPFFDFAKVTFERYSNSFSIDWRTIKTRFN